MAEQAVTIEELTHTFPDGYPVYMKKWRPLHSPPVAKLVFVHGYDDHCNRYYSLFPTLASRGIAVTSWDQRGWGRSARTPSERGLTGPTSLVISDIVHVVKSELSDMKIENDAAAAPVFLMGHSMGGAEILTLATSSEAEGLMPKIRGWLLESPHIALVPSQEPSALKIFAGRVAGHVLPKFQLKHKIPATELTRDPEVVASLENDPLLVSTGTLQGMAGLLDRAADLSSGKRKLNPGVKSLWLAQGTADAGTSYEASKTWFEKNTKDVPDAEFKTYEGWSHQLHADLPDNRDVFAKDVGDWILARAGGPPEETVPDSEVPLVPTSEPASEATAVEVHGLLGTEKEDKAVAKL